MRSLREYLDTVKQKRQPKDSASGSEPAAGKEKDPSKPSVPITGSSMAPSLSTITEASQGDEDLQGPPKLQRLASEENPSASSIVSGISTPSAITTTAGSEVMGGDVGGVEEVGVVITSKGQDAVGAGIFPNTSIMPSTPHSATLTSQFDQSSLLVLKRSDTTPASTPAHQAARAASSEPPSSSGAQNALKTTLQSSVHTTPEHSNTALSDDERRTTVRSNSIESEKGSQNSTTSSVSPDRKQSPGSEGQTPTHKEANLQQPSSSSSVQSSSSRPFVVPIGLIEGSGGAASVFGASGSGGISRTGSEDGSTATPTSVPPTGAILQPHELTVVQSEHSAESTPTHISQSSLESTSSSMISSQEQFSQELKGDKEKSLLGDKASATMSEKGTNGALKKKGQRGKPKQIKLNLVEMTDEKVVKCALVTGTGQMVNFQFSVKYDKPLAIFQKLVGLFTYMYLCVSRILVINLFMLGIIVMLHIESIVHCTTVYNLTLSLTVVLVLDTSINV